MSLCGMALFVGAILFAGISESVAPDLPPRMTMDQIASMHESSSSEHGSASATASAVPDLEDADSFYVLRMDDNDENEASQDVLVYFPLF